jgi:predicted secreted protein
MNTELTGRARMAAAFNKQLSITTAEPPKTTDKTNPTLRKVPVGELTGRARVAAAFNRQFSATHSSLQPQTHSSAISINASAAKGTELGVNIASIRACATLPYAEIRRLIAGDLKEKIKAKESIEALGKDDPEVYHLLDELFTAMAPVN